MLLIPICPHYDTFLLSRASLFTNAVVLWTVAVDVTWKHQCDNELPPSGCRPWARYPTGPTGLQKSQDFSPPQAFQDSPVSFSSNFQESRPAEPPQINQLLKIMHLLLWMLSYIFFSYQQEKNINFHRRNCQIPQNVFNHFIILSRKWHLLTGAAGGSFTD